MAMVMLTPEEKKQLQYFANKNKMALSVYMRQRVFHDLDTKEVQKNGEVIEQTKD